MGFISKDRNQIDCLGYSLSDFVPPHAKCRYVVKLISELDLSSLYQRYSSQGNDAFEPSIMLAVWFLAYSELVTSTRKLEELCKRDLHFIYTSANLKPDHTSFSRFRKNNLDLIPPYFVQILHLAKQKGLSDFKVITLDGTRIQASCSREHSKTAQDIDRDLSRIQQQIQEYMQRCDLADEDEEEPQDLRKVQKKIKCLRNLKKTLLQRKRQLDQRKKKLKTEHREQHKINIIEPDAPMMDHVNGSQKLPGYNAQLSVDTKTQIIVAHDVVQDRNDRDQFSRQHQNIEKNLGSDGERTFIADAGFNSLEQLAYINAFIPQPQPENISPDHPTKKSDPFSRNHKKFQRADFVYHSDADYYECPAGEKLMVNRKFRFRKWHGKIYLATNCSQCPWQQNCLSPKNKSSRRVIRRDDREVLAEKMHAKMQTEPAKQKLKLRSSTVEPVIGNLKQNLGFRRFRLRGYKLVQGEFALMCIAHNINKLYSLLFVFFLLSLFMSKNRMKKSKLCIY
jgi:transposase